MSIRVPSCLYGKDKNFSRFTTRSLEVVQYRHQHSKLSSEVILDQNLLLFVCRGFKQLRVSGQEATLTPAQGAFIPKGSYVMTELSAAATQDGFESLMVLINDDFLAEFYKRRFVSDVPQSWFRMEGEAGLPPWVRFDRTPFLSSSVQSFGVFFEHPECVTALFLEEKVNEVLLYLLEGDSRAALLGHMRYIAAGGRNARLRHFLEAHYARPWSVEDFAEQFGLSVSTFKRECKSVLGMSPKRWINRRRLDSACQQLCAGKDSLTRIAFELGFADSSHFSKMFRKEFNCSPSAYRSALNADAPEMPGWPGGARLG